MFKSIYFTHAVRIPFGATFFQKVVAMGLCASSSYAPLPLDDTEGKLCIMHHNKINRTDSVGKEMFYSEQSIKYYLPEVSLGFHIEKNTLYVYSFDPLTFTPLKYSEDNYMSQKSFDKIVEIYEDQEYLKSFNINCILKEVRKWEKRSSCRKIK